MKREVGRGFTLVELVVAIIVVIVLISIAVFGVSKYRADARDLQRSAQSNTIAEALEKYYTKNGQYPSVRRIVNTFAENSPENVASTLAISQRVLKMPGSKNPQSIASVNSIEQGSLNYFAESAVNNDSCQNAINGGCDRFTLSYRNEAGDTVTITSHFDGAQRSNIAAAPHKPTLTAGAGLVANTVEVTSTEPNCRAADSQLTAMYAYRYRVNDGAWSAWVNWTTSPTFTVGATEGQTIDFVGQTRCDDGATPGNPSPQSNVESYKAPVGAPATPVVTPTNNQTTVTGTVGAVTCPTGETAHYSLRTRTNEGVWSSYGNWATTRTSSLALSEGYKYDFQARIRCSDKTEDAIATTTVASYTQPISTTAAPTINVGSNTTVSTWTWSTPTCPAGATPQYQYQSEANWGYHSPWYGPYSNYTSNTWNTATQGYQYTRHIQARCVSDYATSPWSSSATASYTRPVATPSAPTDFATTISDDKHYVYTNFSAATCGLGTTYEFQYLANWDGSTNFKNEWSPTGLIGYTPRVTQVKTDTNGNYAAFTTDSKTRIQARYRCVNQTTGLVGAWGSAAVSPVFIVP